MKSQYTITFCISLISTIGIYHYHPMYFIVGSILFLLILVFFLKIPHRNSIILCIILGILFGIFRVEVDKHTPNETSIDFYNESDQKLEIEGIICDEVDVRSNKNNYTVCAQKLFIDNSWRNISGKVLIQGERYPVYEYGSQIRINGKLLTPTEFESFSYKDYLSRFGIYSVIYSAHIELIQTGHGSKLFSFLYTLKGNFEQRLNEIYLEPHGSFMAGLLTGSRKGIPEHLMEQFNITGLTHIIAISGFNISIIIIIIMASLKFLPRKTRFLVACITIILFTFFVGASSAVVRASIMGILGLIVLYYGRNSNITITLLLSALIMILWNPRILWFDIGFQLSFLAVMGLLYVSPKIEKYFLWLPKDFEIREGLLLTISAQVFAIPIIVYHFKRLSLISPIANVLVGPAIPGAMLFGFLSVMTSYISFTLGKIFGYIGYLLLEYILFVVNVTSSIPYASVDIYFVGKWMVGLYYLLLVWFLWKKN